MILKTKEASKYIGVSINTLKTLSNNERIKSFKTTGGHRRFMQEDLDSFTGRLAIKPEVLENKQDLIIKLLGDIKNISNAI
jgi:excisionase family DNA binding protein